MIGFPIDELLSEDECYQYLKRSLHPEGLSCPNGHALPDDQAPHASNAFTMCVSSSVAGRR